jgi:hypothetical protein
VIKDLYGMNWLVYLVGGTCHGALGEISTSFVFLVRDWVKPVLVQLWGNSQISFSIRVMNIPLVGRNFMWSNNRNPLFGCINDKFLFFANWEA